MATTRYPRLKLAISALSAASVIAGAAYFRSAQDSGVIEAGDTSQSAANTTTYQPSTLQTTTAQSAIATSTAPAATRTAITNSATTARTSRGS